MLGGRTILPKPNDSLKDWPRRLIHGRRWRTEQVTFVCILNNEHRIALDKPVAVNDHEASNLQSLQFFASTNYCKTCLREEREMIVMVPLSSDGT